MAKGVSVTCTKFEVPGGIAIVCSRGSNRARACAFCGASVRQYVLCDFPLRGKKAGATCSKPACTKCATSIGADKDLCPPHARYAREHGIEKLLGSPKVAELVEDDFGGDVALDLAEQEGGAGYVPPRKFRDLADWTEFFTERAAIGEYERGMSRERAEAEARELAGPRSSK